MGQQISKQAVISGHAKNLLRQVCPEGIDKNGEVTTTKRVFQVRQNCLHTINTTKKDTNINTTATPSPPLPKGAPALLVERDKEADAAVKNFIQNFGKRKNKYQPMSQAEFDRRKAVQLKALFAVGGPNQSAAEKK
jgi:hypothetical protein